MNSAALITLALCLMGVSTAEEAALKAFTAGNNLFSAAVYKEIAKGSRDNFLVSPFSAQTVLALTQSGAKDATAQEIRTSLRLPSTTAQTESAYKTLLPTLQGNEFYALSTANKIYVKTGYTLKDQFQQIARDVYRADLENIDFTAKVEAANSINAWVEKQTNNKIHNLVDPSGLDENTRLVLINALYFKGKWAVPFDTYETAKKDFFRTATDVQKVDTMHVTDSFNYYESAELKAKFLELPYEGGDVSMVIVLPDEKEGLAALESQIEKAFVVPQFNRTNVRVALPRFTIESKIEMNDILKNLGMNTAFSDQADLSGIAGEKGDLAISKVLQKTFINVTESGTEAAAATSVSVVTLSLPQPRPDLKHFAVDRPFLHYLKTRNAILFAGRITTLLQ